MGCAADGRRIPALRSMHRPATACRRSTSRRRLPPPMPARRLVRRGRLADRPRSVRSAAGDSSIANRRLEPRRRRRPRSRRRSGPGGASPLDHDPALRHYHLLMSVRANCCSASDAAPKREPRSKRRSPASAPTRSGASWNASWPCANLATDRSFDHVREIGAVKDGAFPRRKQRSPWPHGGWRFRFSVFRAPPPPIRPRPRGTGVRRWIRGPPRRRQTSRLRSACARPDDASGQEPARVPADQTGGEWLVEGAGRSGDVKIDTFLGRRSLWLRNSTQAIRAGARLIDGTIEFDVAPMDHGDFVAIVFRRESLRNHENIYLRPRSSGEFMAVQYAPRMNGSSTWQLYPEFTARTEWPRNQWTHVRIEVQRIAPGDLRRERRDAGRVGSASAARVDRSGRRGVLGPGQQQAGRMGGSTLEHPDPACALARAADACPGGAGRVRLALGGRGADQGRARLPALALRAGLEAGRRRRVGAGQPQRGLRRAAAAGPLHRVCADLHRGL